MRMDENAISNFLYAVALHLLVTAQLTPGQSPCDVECWQPPANRLPASEGTTEEETALRTLKCYLSCAESGAQVGIKN